MTSKFEAFRFWLGITLLVFFCIGIIGDDFEVAVTSALAYLLLKSGD